MKTQTLILGKYCGLDNWYTFLTHLSNLILYVHGYYQLFLYHSFKNLKYISTELQNNKHWPDY